MFENMEKLEIVNALYGISNLNKQFSNRPYHALIFKIDGESKYTFKTESITLSQGQVLFIPKGESYSVSQISPGESHYALINFTSSLPDASPLLYNCNLFDDFKHYIDRLIRASLFNNLSGRFEMMSLFYKIVSVLYQNNRKNYCDTSKINLIKPATEYLENTIFNSDLKVGNLHMMCNISDTYFRKIFLSIYGVSPKKYVQKKRLAQAKNILDSGEYTHIYEVANSVGFDDALYFSKLFKNTYGYFPSRKN
jgi:AraC-like DNA-binding protein